MNPFYSATRPAMANRPTPLCLLFALCACSCNISLHLVNPSPHPRKLTPNYGECIVLALNDSTPINVDSMAVLSYTPNGIRGMANARVQKTLKTNARYVGANLVKITAYAAYDSGTRHAHEEITANLYKVRNIHDYENGIDWTEHRQLELVDFKGRRDSTRAATIPSHGEYGIFGFEASFSRMNSWMDTTSGNAARLLIHERGNFDLAECYNRMFRDIVGWRKVSFPDPYDADFAPTQARRVQAAYNAERKKYDLLTHYGLDDARQAEWTDKIAHALADRTDTSFLLSPPSTIAQKDSVAKSLIPPPGKVLVYIIRPNRFTSSLPKRMLLNIFFIYPCPYLLFINGVKYRVDYAAAMTTDRIPAHRYVSLLLDPGDRTFSPWATLGNWTYDSPNLDLLLAPGKTYYLRLDMPSRWFAFHARPRLVLISEEEGLRLLRKCRVVRHDENDPPPAAKQGNLWMSCARSFQSGLIHLDKAAGRRYAALHHPHGIHIRGPSADVQNINGRRCRQFLHEPT
jgi:hypothetical protein